MVPIVPVLPAAGAQIVTTYAHRPYSAPKLGVALRRGPSAVRSKLPWLPNLAGGSAHFK